VSPLPRRPILRAVLTLLLAISGLVIAPAPAQAGVTTLCKGYKTCAQAGMSHAGYASASGTMYWRMYSGHNCTNYAAYRMVKSGMPNVRPWEGGGNATYWGTHMSSITDQTPTVGSVAWWKAGVYPAGSAGHVAYVEEVVSPSEIIVSQDSWGGDFSWARVTKTGKGWPNGFIHFNDVALVNLEKPTLSGVPKVGSVLTAGAGVWKPGDVQVQYRWLADGERLAGASSGTLAVGDELLGRKIKVRVIASRLGYADAKATSAATPAILPGTITNTTPPVVSGSSKVDETLTVTAGAWSPTPDAVTYRWLADGEPVAGGRTNQLQLTPDQVGRKVTVEVTAARSGYEPVTIKTQARTVEPGTLQLKRDTALYGQARPGQTLQLTPPSSTRAATLEVRWLREGEPVEPVSETTYEVTEADLGSRITAEVTLTRAGYTTVTQRVASDRVRVPAQLQVQTDRAGRRGSRLEVRVRALPEVDTVVPGVARVKSLGVVKTRELRDNATRLTLRAVPEKSFRVKVIHPRTAVTERSVEVVRIRRR
jgi:surface antigen